MKLFLNIKQCGPKKIIVSFCLSPYWRINYRLMKCSCFNFYVALIFSSELKLRFSLKSLFIRSFLVPFWKGFIDNWVCSLLLNCSQKQCKWKYPSWHGKLVMREISHTDFQCFYNSSRIAIILKKCPSVETLNKRMRAQVSVAKASPPGPKMIIKSNSFD